MTRESPPASPDGLEYLRDLAKRGCVEVAGYGDRHPRDRVRSGLTKESSSGNCD